MKLGLIAWPVLLATSALAPTSGPSSLHPAQDGQDTPALTRQELVELSNAIQKDIEELRGRKFPRSVRVELTDAEGFLEYAKQKLAEDQSPEDAAREEAVAKLLGMIPPDMDLLQITLDVLEEQVGGFYDPDQEAFYLMSRFRGGIAKIIMAHELAHALDDQLYDIDGRLDELESNSDAMLAYHAVVEGSGTAAMLEWTKRNIGQLSLDDLKDAPGLESPSLAVAPEYVWKPLLATYLHGAAFLVHSESIVKGQSRTPENDDIHQAFTHPPRSTEQILHPKKYWNVEQRDEPRTIGFAADDLPEGWTVEDQDTLGELGLALATWPLKKRSGLDAGDPFAMMNTRYTHAASKGWGGDRYLLLSDGSAHVLRMVTLWDTIDDAAEFAAAVDGLSEHIESGAAALASGGPSGLSVERTDQSDEVLVTVWSGVGGEELAAVLAAVRHWEGEALDPAAPMAAGR